MALTDERKNELARLVQQAFPLERRCWDALAEQVGASPEEVLGQMREFVDSGVLREVSAILEGSALGYESALCAGRVPEADIDRVAAVLNAHPTITHNYIREHWYNMWFTLAVPSEMGLEATLASLSDATGVPYFGVLRRTKTFKIGVNFDLEKRRSQTRRLELRPVADVQLDDRTRALFRALQVPLELTDDPFGDLGARTGFAPEELLAHARAHLGGAMRRYVATFRHRRLGVRGNGMAVWAVDEPDQARVGHVLAGAPEVSHCYARDAIDRFPYTVYSMIHGPDRDAVEGIVERLTEETGVRDRIILFSTHELKKCRLRYFLPELDDWWSSHGPGIAA